MDTRFTSFLRPHSLTLRACIAVVWPLKVGGKIDVKYDPKMGAFLWLKNVSPRVQKKGSKMTYFWVILAKNAFVGQKCVKTWN